MAPRDRYSHSAIEQLGIHPQLARGLTPTGRVGEEEDDQDFDKSDRDLNNRLDDSRRIDVEAATTTSGPPSNGQTPDSSTKHPVSFTACGVVGGTAGALIGALMGPTGTVLGAVAGAVIGGGAGEAVADEIDEEDEDRFWRENYMGRPYVDPERQYDDYAPAYHAGYTAFDRHGRHGKTFDEVELEMRSDFVARRSTNSKITWEQSREAARDAWKRVESNGALR